MAETELKRALQREGEEQIRDFWRRAEAVVASRREEIDTEVSRHREETDKRLHTETVVLRNNLHFEVQTRGRERQLHEEAALEQRLMLMARRMLPELAKRDRSKLWKALCEELPTAEWTTLKVYPLDRERAGCDFPAAAIEGDEALGGGLIVTNSDGTIRIDNSLSCRLLRAWPDLLPKLMTELRKQVDNDETAQPDTNI